MAVAILECVKALIAHSGGGDHSRCCKNAGDCL